MKKTYSYNAGVQITPNFNSNEWRCKCGEKHSIQIDDKLPVLLENLMKKIGAKYGNIYSGYRCPKHDKSVGGSGSSSRSHGGYAVDIYFKDNNGKRINSKIVALALEDMGHKYGIGYRCGGSSAESGNIHIDVKPRKWYGDESKSMNKACCSSFYDYFGIKKEEVKPIENKKYIQITAKSGVWCRKGIGFKYSKYKVIPNGTKCELLIKNAGSSNGYKWDKIIYNGVTVYIPNNWNKYL